jgi:hypothetical protein
MVLLLNWLQLSHLRRLTLTLHIFFRPGQSDKGVLGSAPHILSSTRASARTQAWAPAWLWSSDQGSGHSQHSFLSTWCLNVTFLDFTSAADQLSMKHGLGTNVHWVLLETLKSNLEPLISNGIRYSRIMLVLSPFLRPDSFLISAKRCSFVETRLTCSKLWSS